MLTPQYYPTPNGLARRRPPDAYVHELVQRRGVVRDAAGARHDQDLPLLLFLDVRYGIFQGGLVVEEGAGGVDVLVAGHDLVAVLQGERLAGRLLFVAGGRCSGRVRADVDGGSGH
jgi:hypothetical protein